MLNVANLYREHFERILAGAKRTEWRFRRRPDPRLESIRPGEPILLLESGGSTRALASTVRAILRFDREEGCLYAIRLLNPRLISDSRRRIQGWHRVTGS